MSTNNFEEFLSNVPVDRRTEIAKVWQTVRDNMPAGYTEENDAKFLTFKVEKQWYAALANQKNYISLHLLPIYYYPELKAKLDAGGAKNLKIGKGCLNFKRAEEIPLDIIAEIISATDAETFLAHLMKARSKAKSKK